MGKSEDRGQGNVVRPEEMEFNAMKGISEGEMVPCSAGNSTGNNGAEMPYHHLEGTDHRALVWVPIEI